MMFARARGLVGRRGAGIPFLKMVSGPGTGLGDSCVEVLQIVIHNLQVYRCVFECIPWL